MSTLTRLDLKVLGWLGLDRWLHRGRHRARGLSTMQAVASLRDC